MQQSKVRNVQVRWSRRYATKNSGGNSNYGGDDVEGGKKEGKPEQAEG